MMGLAESRTRDTCAILDASPGWRNWQTRRTQNPVAARPCRFDSYARHQHFPVTKFLNRTVSSDNLLKHRFSLHQPAMGCRADLSESLINRILPATQVFHRARVDSTHPTG